MKTTKLTASAVGLAAALCFSSNLLASAQQVSADANLAAVASMTEAPSAPQTQDGARCGSIGSQATITVPGTASSTADAAAAAAVLETSDSATSNQTTWTDNLMQLQGKVTQQTLEFLSQLQQQASTITGSIKSTSSPVLTPVHASIPTAVSPMVLNH